MINVFSYKDVRLFLIDYLENQKKFSSAVKTNLAKALKCQPAYLSKILKDQAYLSPEQANLCCHFFDFTENETHYFMLMNMENRAGTQTLKNYYKKQMIHIVDARKKIENRVTVSNQLKNKDKITYYSSWEYAAIHVLVSIPGFQNLEKISDTLLVPRPRCSKILEDLEQMGLISIINEKFVPTNQKIHIGSSSLLSFQHHANWRIQAIQKMKNGNDRNLNYTSIISYSEKDTEIIREKLLKTIDEIRKIVSASKEEKIGFYTIDFMDFDL